MKNYKPTHIKQLNRYFVQLLRQISNSQFVVKSFCEVPALNRFALSSESKKIKTTHYLFMYLLARDKKAHLIKYKIPTKYKKQAHRIKKNSKIIIRLSPTMAEHVLHLLLFEVIPQIFTSEEVIFKVNKHNIKLLINNVPLMEESLILQSSSGYLSPIPLALNFSMPYTTLYQKLFIMRTVKMYSYTLKNNFDIDESVF
jgi:hypothetical protein